MGSSQWLKCPIGYQKIKCSISVRELLAETLFLCFFPSSHTGDNLHETSLQQHRELSLSCRDVKKNSDIVHCQFSKRKLKKWISSITSNTTPQFVLPLLLLLRLLLLCHFVLVHSLSILLQLQLFHEHEGTTTNKQMRICSYICLNNKSYISAVASTF